MWTKNFQIYKLGLEKAQEPESKLPTFVGSWRKRGNSRKTSTSSLTYAKAFNCVDHNRLWKILKEIRVPDHLTCLLRSLYVSQEATITTGRETTDWFKIGNGICSGWMLSPCLLLFYAAYIIQNARLDKPQTGIKIATRNLNNLRFAETLMAENEEELKRLLMRVKEESEKAGLKHNIQKT